MPINCIELYYLSQYFPLDVSCHSHTMADKVQHGFDATFGHFEHGQVSYSLKSHGRRNWVQGILKFSARKVVFLVSSGKNEISLLARPRKIFGKNH